VLSHVFFLFRALSPLLFNAPSSHKEEVTYFADLWLPVPLKGTFTYRLPRHWEKDLVVGMRVLVNFGGRGLLTGLVRRIHQTPPEVKSVKYILDILDKKPYLEESHLEFWQWVADYYLAPIGDVMQAALPAGMKLSSQSKVQLQPAFDLSNLEQDPNYSPAEKKLLYALQEAQTMDYDQIAELLGTKNIHGILKKLIDKFAILLYEQVKDKFSPKIIKKVRLSKSYQTREKVQALLSELPEKQNKILVRYLALLPILQNQSLNEEGVAKDLLLTTPTGESLSKSSYKTLQEKGIFEEFNVIISRIDIAAQDFTDTLELSVAQRQAENQILHLFETKTAVLLHGITGSGKTEIYISLIKKTLEAGGQVLLLLPEIALTTQIVARLRRVFGKAMGVYHSGFSDNERAEVCKGIVEGTIDFVVGVRSSIFLPFRNLSLLIVDEEHDASYKQVDPSPRYQARDAALYLGHKFGAKVLLGSATPSIETYYLAKNGVYGYVHLNQRYADAVLPDIETIDLRPLREKNQMKGNFSPPLLEALANTLEKQQQAILFQNRRGYAPYLQCQVCHHIPTCRNCSVSLTYHQYSQELRCHYCGHREKLHSHCTSCGSERILPVGFGTEKLEDELPLYLPSARVLRMDRDTTKTRAAYERIIEAFEKHQVDVLVGTQMVTKGLDFERVSLVGVFDMDRLLRFPDFRAQERAFQLLTQVSGRAGRKQAKGLVLIQTLEPRNPILYFVKMQDYAAFFEKEIRERQLFDYPPFVRLIELTVKHTDLKVSQKLAELILQNLKSLFGQLLPQAQLLGVSAPLVDRVRNYYLRTILIKIPRNSGNLATSKKQMAEMIAGFLIKKEFRTAQVVIDVDCV
jgi:primosomal protein N' (replication factor Y)